MSIDFEFGARHFPILFWTLINDRVCELCALNVYRLWVWTFNKTLLKFDILHFAKCVRDLCAFYVCWLWVVSKILLNCILYFDKWLYPLVVCFTVYRYWIVNKTLYDCVCELWAFNVYLLRVANRIPIRKGIFQSMTQTCQLPSSLLYY